MLYWSTALSIEGHLVITLEIYVLEICLGNPMGNCSLYSRVMQLLRKACFWQWASDEHAMLEVWRYLVLVLASFYTFTQPMPVIIHASVIDVDFGRVRWICRIISWDGLWALQVEQPCSETAFICLTEICQYCLDDSRFPFWAANPDCVDS